MHMPTNARVQYICERNMSCCTILDIIMIQSGVRIISFNLT